MSHQHQRIPQHPKLLVTNFLVATKHKDIHLHREQPDWTQQKYTTTIDKKNASVFHSAESTYNLNPPLLHFSKTKTLAMSYQGQLYDKVDIERSGGACQPTNRYQWGFSLQLTCGFLLATNVPSLALFLVWCAAGPRKSSERADRTFDRLRTALLAAEAVAETCGENRTEMSNAELKKAMRAPDVGISFSSQRAPRIDKLPLLARLEQLPLEDLCGPSTQALAVLRSRDDLRGMRFC